MGGWNRSVPYEALELGLGQIKVFHMHMGHRDI